MFGQHHAPATLPQERPGIQCTGGQVGLGDSRDGTENLAHLEIDPCTVQPVASCYTDYGTLAATATQSTE
jgi:hypothetical protein